MNRRSFVTMLGAAAIVPTSLIALPTPTGGTLDWRWYQPPSLGPINCRCVLDIKNVRIGDTPLEEFRDVTVKNEIARVFGLPARFVHA